MCPPCHTLVEAAAVLPGISALLVDKSYPFAGKLPQNLPLRAGAKPSRPVGVEQSVTPRGCIIIFKFYFPLESPLDAHPRKEDKSARIFMSRPNSPIQRRKKRRLPVRCGLHITTTALVAEEPSTCCTATGCFKTTSNSNNRTTQGCNTLVRSRY